jgi:formylglycine-generating enzyme required for sulfatase activity
MSGNVWEWVWDWYAEYPQGRTETSADPTGPTSGSARVYRGGSFDFPAQALRVAARAGFDPSDRDGILGFRLSRSFPSSF